MTVYSVSTARSEPNLKAAIESHYPGKHYAFSSSVIYLKTHETPKQVAVRLGVKNRDSEGAIVEGISDVVVMKVSPVYYGWANKGVWDWLKSALQEDDG